MNLTSSELRARARATLGGNIFARNWLMGLVVSMVCMLILNAASSATCGIAAFILTGPIYFGLYKTYLTSVRSGKEIGFDNLFDGFSSFAQTLLLGLMETVFILLWTMLFIIPGIVKSYSYSMAYYIMVDHPEYTWKQCITESRMMMKGNKWKLFCLDLSFIGWIIVGLFACGVGTLWVTPYQETARVEFYNQLKGATESEETPADGAPTENATV